jgi:hypothetical protein
MLRAAESCEKMVKVVDGGGAIANCRRPLENGFALLGNLSARIVTGNNKSDNGNLIKWFYY